MTIKNRRLKMFLCFGVLALSACQSRAAPTYAVLDSMDSQTMATLKSTLAQAMNKANVEIGPGDLTKTSTVSVLPPRPTPNEDRSTVKPVLFDIVMKGGECYVVRRETGEQFVLTGVSCKPL